MNHQKNPLWCDKIWKKCSPFTNLVDSVKYTYLSTYQLLYFNSFMMYKTFAPHLPLSGGGKLSLSLRRVLKISSLYPTNHINQRSQGITSKSVIGEFCGALSILQFLSIWSCQPNRFQKYPLKISSTTQSN